MPPSAASEGAGWPLNRAGDELYRLHTSDMKDTLYYHALLTARSDEAPITAHMLRESAAAASPGALRDEAVASALMRLGELTGRAPERSGAQWGSRPDIRCPAAPQVAPGGDTLSNRPTGPSSSCRHRISRRGRGAFWGRGTFRH